MARGPASTSPSVFRRVASGVLLSTFKCRLLTSFGLLPFPQISTILSNAALPQTLSHPQLEPHRVNPATSIRITNKLSLTSITIGLSCHLNSALQPGPLDSLSGFLRS